MDGFGFLSAEGFEIQIESKTQLSELPTDKGQLSTLELFFEH